MFGKFSIANRFLFTQILLFFIFWIGLKYFFTYHSLTNEENESALKLLSWIFLGLNLSMALYFFHSKQFKINFNSSNLIIFSIIFLLASTFYSTKVSAYATSLFIIFVIVISIVKKFTFNRHPLLWAMLMYYLFQLIGLLWTVDIDNGIKYIDKGLSFIVIPLAFSFINITNFQREKILLIFFRFVNVFMLMGMIGYIFQIYFHHLNLSAGFVLEREYLYPILNLDHAYKQIFVSSGYGHPAYYSIIFSTMIPTGFYFWKKDKNDSLRITTFELITYSILSAGLIFILKSRVGLFMFPLGYLLTLLFLFRNNKRMPLFLVSILIMAVISILGICKFKLGFSFLSDPIRENILLVVFKYIKLHPWTGTGTGSMALELLSTVNQAINPHNQFIGEIFHLGIPGLFVFLLFMGQIIYFGIKNKNYMLLYFIAIFTILMMTEMPLAIQKGVSIFTLFCCLLARPNWQFREKNKYPDSI